ncbi:hypothetical protein RN001_007727 [Aquatica leii]|uniref:Uncharacterized protein n=1 Tax=Aquatica leii TaxID=1421715 RepID=A0AAN7PC58_9COLE|nr:hypothetical protein RN001_007727 [Aquatica leii]
MKLVIVLSAIVWSAYSITIPLSTVKSWYDVTAPYQETCIQESDVDPDIARNMLLINTLPNEMHMRCYLKCLHEKLNFYLPNGDLDKDLMVKTFDHVTPEIGDMCFAKFGSEPDHCLKSYRIVMCGVQATLEAESQ